jgi:hypothetical protein
VGAIVLQVDEVVDDVDARGAKREGDQRHERLRDRLDGEEMRREEGDQNQGILGVLMHAQELGPGFPGGTLAREVINVGRVFRETAPHPTRRSNRDSPRGLLPDGQIGRIVADIIEAALAERVHELPGFDGSGQVRRLVGCEPAVEKADVVGHFLDEPAIAGRCQINGATVASGLLDQGKHFPIVGQGARIEVGRGREAVFQGGLPARESGHHLEERLRPPPEFGEGGLDQEIGGDERAVEIHHERSRIVVDRRLELSGDPRDVEAVAAVLEDIVELLTASVALQKKGFRSELRQGMSCLCCRDPEREPRVPPVASHARQRSRQSLTAPHDHGQTMPLFERLQRITLQMPCKAFGKESLFRGPCLERASVPLLREIGADLQPSQNQPELPEFDRV